MMRMLLFADAGPGPLLFPMGGSVVIAGVFLTLAGVSGGLWLIRRSQDRPAFACRKMCLASLGAACLSGAVTPAILGLFIPALLIVAGGLTVAGVVLMVIGWRSPNAK